MTRWERMSEWPLVAVSGLFLAAWAWPILDPDLARGRALACSAVLWAAWFIFLLDYVVRLAQTSERGGWFAHHLLDLLVIALPLLRPLRLLRLVTLLRVLNRSASSGLRGRVGLYVACGSALLAFVAAVAALDAERDAPDASITTLGDALWWACTTMTTVGYGDLYPVTSTGRMVGVGLMVAGIALLGTVTATLASWLIEAVTIQTAEALDPADQESTIAAEVAALRRELAALTMELQRQRDLQAVPDSRA